MIHFFIHAVFNELFSALVKSVAFDIFKFSTRLSDLIKKILQQMNTKIKVTRKNNEFLKDMVWEDSRLVLLVVVEIEIEAIKVDVEISVWVKISE